MLLLENKVYTTTKTECLIVGKVSTWKKYKGKCFRECNVSLGEAGRYELS